MSTQGRRFRAAIFDLDGLLVDSEPLWQQAEIECFGAVGVPLTREQARETVGLRSDAVVAQRFREFGWDAGEHPLETVEKRIVDRVVELLGESAQPMPGALEALDLVENLGLRLALASSSRRNVIDAALQALGIADRFEVVHSGAQERFGKPHPAVYRTTARMLDLPPGRCVAFEDSLAGLEAARAAGMACVVVPDGSIAGHTDLRAADLVLSSLSGLSRSVWQALQDS